MCGRFFRHEVSWAEYYTGLRLIVPEETDPPEAAYNIAPTQYAPIIRHATEDEDAEPGTLSIFPAMWGLVPSWWNKPLKEKKFSTFNARSETVAESNAYRGAFRHRRALIPMSGYYEWSGPKGDRTPYAVNLRNRRWFCCAGLWDRAFIDGSQIDSFTILTTSPNPKMRELHHRVPVILDPAHYQRWLDTQDNNPKELFEPPPDEAMDFWPVGKSVGNVRSQGRHLIDAV